MRKRSTIIVIFSLGIIVILYPHIAQWVNSYLQKGQVEDFHNIEMSDDELDQLMAKA
ncbi:hypothetical protein [Pseudogracilibacillus auburnensis]|nr:hypothetical protein [Pseudogracilibacillus auburnensis]MBO1002359.1 hypothetical protein [Pseudogracilibacillus auburnensis]